MHHRKPVRTLLARVPRKPIFPLPDAPIRYPVPVPEEQEREREEKEKETAPAEPVPAAPAAP